jgi:hypothetical protein
MFGNALAAERDNATLCGNYRRAAGNSGPPRRSISKPSDLAAATSCDQRDAPIRVESDLIGEARLTGWNASNAHLTSASSPTITSDNHTRHSIEGRTHIRGE